METKIRNFLQSDFLIMAIALLIGFSCHFFVKAEVIAGRETLSSVEHKDRKSYLK
jgi:hypothetical protein